MSRNYMSQSWKLIALLIVVSGASFASAQSVGRVSPAPLNFSGSGESMSRPSRPAPVDPIEGVVRASYYQAPAGRSTAPAPTSTRVASSRGINYGSITGAIPIQSLPPASNVPIYYPTSYSTRSYAAPQTGYYPTSYTAGAANRAPTLIPTAAYQQGCGPQGAPAYPISTAPTPYAAPQAAAPGARPFIPIASMPNQVYVSRGIIGQPVVYVPGQPLRNGLRYILP